VERLTRSLREDAVQELDVDTGETVVDLGCGPGGSFSLVAQAVAPAGEVLGVDYSAEMVDSAADRAAGIPAVSVLRGDAAELPLRPDSVDGVFASLALSAMPELETVLDEIARVVRPGGHLVVLDGQVPDGALGSAVQRVYYQLVNVRNPDVLATLESRFTSVTVVERFDAGLGFVARVELG
jgi:demethylmenaquinone methyltransferase/2-methoxy-6-polyprenyl-1,4-benzoquinol methylase